MKSRPLVTLLMLAVVLNGCSGGGTSGAPAVPPLPKASAQSATGTLTIDRPATSALSTSRKPLYISPSTTYASLWIDDSATATRVACSSVQCTINWISTSGTHTFAVAVDDSVSISGGGQVLADNSESVTLAAGTNTLPNLTLNGVAAKLTFLSQTGYAAGSTACSNFEFQGANAGLNCFIGSFDVDDADGNTISNTTAGATGAFDNGGVCVSETGAQGNFYLASSIGTFCYSAIGDPTVTSGYNTTFIATCQLGTPAPFTFAVVGHAYNVVLNVSPQAGEISPLQLAAYTLVYPDQNYAMLLFPTYNCTASGTIN